MKLPRSRKLWLIPAGAVVLAFFKPPYSTLRGPFGGFKFEGYAWLWNIPGIHDAVVTWPLLLAELLAIGLVAGALWLAFRE